MFDALYTTPLRRLKNRYPAENCEVYSKKVTDTAALGCYILNKWFPGNAFRPYHDGTVSWSVRDAQTFSLSLASSVLENLHATTKSGIFCGVQAELVGSLVVRETKRQLTKKIGLENAKAMQGAKSIAALRIVLVTMRIFQGPQLLNEARKEALRCIHKQNLSVVRFSNLVEEFS